MMEHLCQVFTFLTPSPPTKKNCLKLKNPRTLIQLIPFWLHVLGFGWAWGAILPKQIIWTMSPSRKHHVTSPTTTSLGVSRCPQKQAKNRFCKDFSLATFWSPLVVFNFTDEIVRNNQWSTYQSYHLDPPQHDSAGMSFTETLNHHHHHHPWWMMDNFGWWWWWMMDYDDIYI